MAGLILLIVVTLAGSIGWFAGDRAARWAAVERQVDLALQEATQLMEQARWPEARAWLERADGLLAGGGSRDEVRQRVSALRNDLDLVQRLEEVRMEKAAVLDGDMTYAEVDSRYAQAFGDYGIDLDEPGADGVAERIRQSAVCTELAAMIDDWAMVRRRARGSGELGSRNPRWPYPSARWVKECERLVELDGKLAAVLSGEQPVSDAAERIEYADLCYKKRSIGCARTLIAAGNCSKAARPTPARRWSVHSSTGKPTPTWPACATPTCSQNSR
jgi:hypothetical protein